MHNPYSLFVPGVCVLVGGVCATLVEVGIKNITKYKLCIFEYVANHHGITYQKTVDVQTSVTFEVLTALNTVVDRELR